MTIIPFILNKVNAIREPEPSGVMSHPSPCAGPARTSLLT